jgi:hypothetical protein
MNKLLKFLIYLEEKELSFYNGRFYEKDEGHYFTKQQIIEQYEKDSLQ